MKEEKGYRLPRSGGTAIVACMALVRVALHLATFARYGYFRDELYYIACSEHLAWGYVDQPPLSIFFLKLVRILLGESLFAIRLLPMLAGVATIFLAGLMARKLGGGRLAQGLAAFAALASPILLGISGRNFSMNAFDILFWTLGAYILILIVQDERPRLWLAFGAVSGLGLLNKYSMGFFLFGVGCGLLLTRQRQQFRSRWLWLGGLLALLVFSPHLMWELRNGFPSLEFMHNAAFHKNALTSPAAFFLGQLREAGSGSVPLWLLGFVFFIIARRGKTFRFFAWAYGAVFLVMAIQNGKPYYLSPFFPVIFAAGGVMAEEIAGRRRWRWLGATLAVLALLGMIVNTPFTLPILSARDFIKYQQALGQKPERGERSRMGLLPQHYADMHGWEEMTALVANIYQRLTPAERQDCLVFLRNYGEAGAIDFFGHRYGLPRAVCGHNSYWFWGCGDWRGGAAIVFGSTSDVEECLRSERAHFEQVELAGFTDCDLAMPYENHRPVFLCRRAKFSLQEYWPSERFFI